MNVSGSKFFSPPPGTERLRLISDKQMNPGAFSFATDTLVKFLLHLRKTNFLARQTNPQQLLHLQLNLFGCLARFLGKVFA